MSFILAVLVIMLFYMNYQKEGEVRKLKKQIKSLEEKIAVLKEYVKRYVDESGNMENIQNHRKEDGISTENFIKNIENTPEITDRVNLENVRHDGNNDKVKERVAVSKEDSRNTLILSAGAVFIILAAIVFLISTWYVIPNIIKTVILIVFIEVFLGLSKVAKEKFNLPNASNTFFYIAMAYIPICLYSISYFKLFGEFLSIDGSGKNIYFMLVNCIIAVIYMYQYNKNKSKVLLYGSILMQYLTVIFFSLIFGTNYVRVLLSLGLYNILVYMFMNKFDNRNVLNLCFSVMVLVLSILTIGNVEKSIWSVANLFVLAINYLCLERNKSSKIYSVLFNFILSIAGVCFIYLFTLDAHIKEVLSLIYFVSIFVVQNSLIINKNKENLKFSSIVVTVGFILLLQINAYVTDSIVSGYLYSLVNMVILFIAHGTKDRFIKDASSVLIPIELICTYFNIGVIYTFGEHYYMICAILTFVVGECIKNPKLEKLNKMFLYVSNINLIYTFFGLVIDNNEFFNNFIYLIIMTEIYGYIYMKNQKKYIYFKYLDYVFVNLSLISICECFDLSDSVMCMVPLVTSIIITVLEELLPKLESGKLFKDNFSEIYISINSIFAFAWIYEADITLLYILGLVYAIGMMYRYTKNKENVFYNLIPLVGFFMVMENMQMNEAFQVILYAISIASFGILSIKNKDVNVFTIAGYTSIMFISDIINQDLLLNFVAFAYTLVHVYYMENEKYKDGYRIVTSIIFFSVYFELLDLMGLEEILGFTLFGILAIISYLSRAVVRKYVKDIKYIEYILIALTYLAFISEATVLADAIGIILVELIFMVYSYYRKFGSQFIVNTAMLIVSGIYLTKGFWAIIPWWLYLLAIGTVLIALAIRNEAKEKKEKISVGKILDDVIEKIEK